MFTVSLFTAVIAIAQIFAMGAVGFILVRRQIVNQDGLRLLTFLSINIFFPLFIFYQITHFFDPVQTPFWWGFPLINVCMVIVSLGLARLIFIFNRMKLKDEVLAAASLHNAGYIPLLLSMSLPLGAMAGKVYTAVILSIIGFDFCLWSIGVWLLTRAGSGKMDLRSMINPPLIAMSAAIVCVLTQGYSHIPPEVFKPMKILGDSAMATAMIIIGGNLASARLESIQLKPLVGVVLTKLVLLPTLVLTCLLFLNFDPMISFVVMVQACMPTSISLSIIGRHYGTGNQDFINQSIFFSHLACLVTLPIFLGLYGKFIH